ncbi:MAG: hypothetical protein ACI93N_000975 [Flavobacteriaceae bacterium]|jgi:hypothetical protein
MVSVSSEEISTNIFALPAQTEVASLGQRESSNTSKNLMVWPYNNIDFPNGIFIKILGLVTDDSWE